MTEQNEAIQDMEANKILQHIPTLHKSTTLIVNKV